MPGSLKHKPAEIGGFGAEFVMGKSGEGRLDLEDLFYIGPDRLDILLRFVAYEGPQYSVYETHKSGVSVREKCANLSKKKASE